MAQPIENATVQVLGVLGKGLGKIGLSAQARSDLDTIMVRLNIWAGHMGVFAGDAASLDDRLRNNGDISDVLHHLLVRLKQALEFAINPPLLEEEEEEEDDDNNYDDEGSRDNKSDASSASTLSLDRDDAESDMLPSTQIAATGIRTRSARQTVSSTASADCPPSYESPCHPKRTKESGNLHRISPSEKTCRSKHKSWENLDLSLDGCSPINIPKLQHGL